MGISKTVSSRLKWLRQLGYSVAIIAVMLVAVMPMPAFAADDCNAQGECGEGTIGEQRLRIVQMHPNFIAEWQQVEGADHYNVYRGSDLIQSGTQTSFTDTSTPDGQYWFFFSIVYADGTESSPVSIQVKVDRTPPTITYTTSPEANAAGWVSASRVRVVFSCQDAELEYCSPQEFITAEGANQTVTGIARDRYGNESSATVTVNLDKSVPVLDSLAWSQNPIKDNETAVLTANASDAPTGAGIAGGEYFMGDGSTDPGEGNATPMQLANGQLTATFSNLTPGTYEVWVRVKDLSDKWSQASSTQLVVTPSDVEPPVVSGVIASPNPKNVAATGAITANATDDASGVALGEYFIGSDPGQGSGMSMTYDNGQLTGTLGTDLPVGAYQMYVRAKDVAGNWSAPVSTKLVVKQTGTSGVTASGSFTPSVADGDQLPSLDSAAFKLAQYYQNVNFGNSGVNNGSNMYFTYKYGSSVLCGVLPTLPGCHQLTLASSGNISITSVTFSGTNNSQALVTGTATVTLDGVATTNPFTITAVSALRAGSGSNSYSINIYAPGTTVAPENLLYTASNTGTVTIF